MLLAPEQGELRKPETGMWRFFQAFCNGGVKIGGWGGGRQLGFVSGGQSVRQMHLARHCWVNSRNPCRCPGQMPSAALQVCPCCCSHCAFVMLLPLLPLPLLQTWLRATAWGRALKTQGFAQDLGLQLRDPRTFFGE